MSTIEVPDVALGTIATSREMRRVTAELYEVAAAVDRVSEVSHPSMELLEASRAIRSALVSLSNSSGFRDAGIPVPMSAAGGITLQDAWIAARPAEPSDAGRSSWLDD